MKAIQVFRAGTVLTLLMAAELVGAQDQQLQHCPINDETKIGDALYFLEEGGGDPAIRDACRRSRSGYLRLAKAIQQDFIAKQISIGWAQAGTDAAAAVEKSLVAIRPSTRIDSAQLATLYTFTADQLNLAATDWNDPKYWGTDFWKISPSVPDPGAPWPRVNKLLTGVGCGNKMVSSAICGSQYREAGVLINHILVMHDVVEAYLSDVRQRVISDTSINYTGWNSYFDATQFQYPWELGINYFFDAKFSHEQERDLYGNPIGLRIPRSGRWIALHPDVGVSYFDDEPNGDRFAVSLLFEWIGYQWTGLSDKSKVKWPIGIGIVSTWSDTKVIDSSGLGLMLHYKRFGIAVTSNHGDLGITLNFNLFRAFQNNESKYAQKLKLKIPEIPGWEEVSD